MVRFCEDPDILRDLVHFEKDLGEHGVKVELIACVTEASLGYAVRRRRRHCVYVGGRPCEDDGRHCDRFQSSRTRRVRNENGDNATADTQLGNPDLTARRLSSGPEVYADDAVSVPGRPCRPERRHYARSETTDPTCMGMLQSIQAGAVTYGGCPVYHKGAHA